MKSKSKMKRAGRKRRAAGWTLLALGLLVAAVWIQSRWTNVSVTAKLWEVSCCRGVLRFDVLMQGDVVLHQRTGVRANTLFYKRANWEWRAPRDWLATHSVDLFIVTHERLNSSEGTVTDFFAVTLWPIPLLLWTPAALLLRSGIIAGRRAMSGLCTKCGYSLAGLPAGSPCPECGKGAGTK